MIGVLLAAGEGKRLRPLTEDRPKCLVELAGRPLLLHQLDTLTRVGIEDLVVVTGYRADRIEALELGLTTRHNPRFAHTNMVASLMCASDLLDGRADVLIAYTDIVYEPRVVQALLDHQGPLATTVDRRWRTLWQIRMDDPLADAETLELDAAGNIVEIGREPAGYDDIMGQYMGLIKVRRDFVPTLVATHRSLDPAGPYRGRTRDDMYMTTFLQHLIDRGHPVHAVMVEGGWLEVDDVGDLESYERMWNEGTLDRLCRLRPS